MGNPPDTVVEKAKVREVAGIFQTRAALEAAASDLLLAGFDRTDIDPMATPDGRKNE